MEITDLLNPKSKAFKDLKLQLDNTSPEEASQLVAQNPRIMYRPLLTDGERLVIGFKPEEMAKLVE